MSTKEKILKSAINLFNEHGIASVRLQQIADESAISVGNLAYHFKNKEQIVISAYEMLFEDFDKILSQYLSQSTFEDFDYQAALLYDFFTEYQFYLADLFTEQHSIPFLKERWQSCTAKLLVQIRKRLDFHVRKGDLINANAKVYDLLAENLLMILIFWIPQQKISNHSISLENYKKIFWNNILPYISGASNNLVFNTSLNPFK